VAWYSLYTALQKNVTSFFSTAIIPLILNAVGQYIAEILPEEFAICCCAQLLIIWSCSWEPACVAMVTDLKKRRAQELTTANCIVPDLCVSFYAGCWLHFLHRWKDVHCNSTSQQSKWLRVCSHDYHDVTSLPTNSYVPAWLSVKHWWYQLLSQSWICLGLVFVDPGKD